jgi:ATP-binding cassette subfamily F protein uup
LQKNIRALHARLDDPGLYARDRKAFDDTSAALVAAEAELAAAEQRWLELEIMREEIDAG